MGNAPSNGNNSCCRSEPAANGNTKQNGYHSNVDTSVPPTTAFQQFLCGQNLARARPCIGVRPTANAPYEWKSYNQVLSDVKSIGAYLTKELGLTKGSFVGTLCSNCPQLLTLELACYAYGIVIVPLYDTLGIDACQHIVQESNLRVILCRSRKQADTVLSIADKLNANYADFTLLLADKDTAGDDTSTGVARSHKSFDEILEVGKGLQVDLPDKDYVLAADLAVICYTSGTTGQPKGVMLTNGNLSHGVNLVRDTMAETTFRNGLTLSTDDTYFSYLPMAHILERMSQLFTLRHGASIGFFTGDRARLMDDLQACGPTFLAAVPKIISRIYDAAHAATADSAIKSAMLSMALKRKNACVQDMQLTHSTIWDKVVLRKLQSGLGGRLRLVAIGGAPISEDALRFAKAAFGCAVVQGFGQTETCGLGLCQRAGDPSADNTGMPMIGVEVKLVDVPDMNYFAEQSYGELCIRGPSCFSGYYRQEQRTNETKDSEGWVHTGDIAHVRQDGSYKVVDRAKHLFKLAQGEYVAPEKIEIIYSLCPVIDQVFIDGNSEQSYLLGVVVPYLEAARKWAASIAHLPNADGLSLADLCCNAEFKQFVLEQMLAMGREKGLHGFEQVKDIILNAEAFTTENDLVTPTLKLKRPQLRKYYAKQFTEMYKQLPK